jgi:hypothetical protein
VGRLAVGRADLRTVRVARLEVDELVVRRVSGLPSSPATEEGGT